MKLIIPALIVLFSVISSEGQVCPLKIPIKDCVNEKNNYGSETPRPSSAVTITLRCNSTPIENSNVIYVVDGVLVESKEISQLNPSDIISIDILKSSQQIFSCGVQKPVIIITTKKIYHQKFIIRDAKSMLAIGNATIEAKSTKTGKLSYFVADAFGRFETDSLKTNEYDLTISSTGYKTKTIGLKNILQNNGEIKLEREFVELKEVMIVAYPKISCRSMSSTCLPASLYSRLGCPAHGISVTKEHQTAERSFNVKKDVQIYPNPVVASGTINISFSNIKPGQYQIRMLNAAGQLFYSFQKQITGKGETEQIHLNGITLPGIYIVQVTDEQKKLLQSSRIVVQ